MDSEKKTPLYWQNECILPVKSRGIHLITEQIKQAMLSRPPIFTGLAHLFLLHTSASLIITENTCFDVWTDLENFLTRLVPDSSQLYRHHDEGDDDMPAHIKNALLGNQLLIPIHQGQLVLGKWQGIFLAEHRDNAPARKIMLTLQGIAR